MSKFKVGDRVVITKDSCFEANLGDEVTVTDVINGGVHFETANGRECYHSEEYFELIGGTMNVGDILVDRDGDTRKVLAYLNQGVEVVLLSENNKHDETKTWYTATEVKEEGWKLQTEPKVTEKTVAEIEQEMNLQPGSLRIKKED